jgi:phosphoribosylglycinamide formyltransferase-1
MLTRVRPLRVAVLCSRRAPGLEHLLHVARGHGDVEVVCVVSSHRDSVVELAMPAAAPPLITHDIRAFYARRPSTPLRDLVTRRVYDRETADLLAAHAPDVVVFAGYLYIATGPLLDAYRHRIVNLHFSDLTRRRPDRRPAYPGIHAVREAIADGVTETRATVHLVNGEPDGGAPLVRSWSFPVSPLAARARAWSAEHMLHAYAYAHQEWMIREVSGPLLQAALGLIADGRLDLDAIGALHPEHVAPWIVDSRGRLLPPSAASSRHPRGLAAETQERRNARTQERGNAGTQERKIARTQERKHARTQEEDRAKARHVEHRC